MSFRRLNWLGLCALATLGCEDLLTVIASQETGGTGGEGLGGASGGEGPTTGGAQGQGGEGGTPAPGLDFEAEDGQISGAFSVGQRDDVVFLTADVPADPSQEPGMGRAIYDFTIAEAGDYVIWGRMYGPTVANNRFWFRVDEMPWYLWRVATGQEWSWDDLHDNLDYGTPLVFSLTSGEHRLELANAVTGAEVDKFSIRLATSEGPDNPVECNPPHSVLLDGVCVRSCGSYGETSCGEGVCAGQPELVSYDCALCCLVQ